MRKDQLFRLLGVEWVDVADAEMCRLEDGTTYLKIGKSKVSREVVLLEVTLDFWLGKFEQNFRSQSAECPLNRVIEFGQKRGRGGPNALSIDR